MKKKCTSMILALILCLSMVLSACGGGGGNGSNGGQTQAGAGDKGSTQAAGSDNSNKDASDNDTAEAAGTNADGADSANAANSGNNNNNDNNDNNGAATGEPKTGGILKIGTGQNPTIIGYTPEISANAQLQFLRTVFNSLCFYDEDGKLAPELAESWETDADAATITFHLRSGVKFSDGTDFNAKAVKWNLEQYKSVGRTEAADIKTIECPDENTVVITLEAWRSSALESIGFFVYYMSPTAFEENGGADWARLNAVGTGPFLLKSFEQGVGVKYEKNPNYWESGKPYLDGVEYTIISEPTTLENALTAGEIDMISYASIDSLRNLEPTGNFIRETNQNGNGVETTGVIPSSSDENSPFANALVRQAMCYAIDADTIVESLGYGYYTRTNQWAAPGAITYNDDVEGYPYNPEKAKELLVEAGYPDGFDTQIYAMPGIENWATAIADQLTQVGIRTQVEMIDGTKGNDMMTNGWDGIYWHFASVSPDLGLYMGRHLDPSGAFYAKGIQHPQDCLDLLAQIRTAKDDDTKIAAELELQKKIYDEYALFGMPLYVSAINAIKYPYVCDDNYTRYHVATWTPANCWMDK